MYQPQAFGYRAWQEFLTAVLVGPGIVRECIAPFGFEVTGDASYLSHALRRFYVYVIPQDGSETADVEPRVAEAILHSPRPDVPSFIPDVGLVVTTARTISVAGPGQSMLYVKALPDTAGPIVEAYARYLAAAPALIHHRHLLEIGGFSTRSSCRRYVFQLTVAGHFVYGDVSGLAEPELRLLYSLIRACKDRDLATGEPAWFPPTEEESSALREIVGPVHDAWASHLESGSDIIPVRIVEFTSGQTHELAVSRAAFARAASFVADSYRSYPSLAKELCIGPGRHRGPVHDRGGGHRSGWLHGRGAPAAPPDRCPFRPPGPGGRPR